MFLIGIWEWLRAPFEVYTDGSCKNGRGSWAYVVTKRGSVLREASGFVRNTSSNEMEIRAVAEAIRSFSKRSRMTICTDSRILVTSVGKGLILKAWPEHCESILLLQKKHEVSWRWVRAHAGNDFNERCDELCVIARTI